MRAILIDAYRADDKVVLWMKTPDDDFRVRKGFTSYFYVEKTKEAEDILRDNRIPYNTASKRAYYGQDKAVLEIPVWKLNSYESMVRFIERKTRYRVPLYNADITPESMYLYKHRLRPFMPVEIKGEQILPLDEDVGIPLKEMSIKVFGDPIRKIALGDRVITGTEESIIKEFVTLFNQADPDIVYMDHAFSKLPLLAGRIRVYGLDCRLHRWDPVPVRYRGGKSFFSYGRVIFRDFAIRLHGRLLVDSTAKVGQDCPSESIVELCQLSGHGFQQTASRSYGAVFQASLVRELVEKDYLVPYKEKPIDAPMTFFDLLKADRAGLSLDPKVGFHDNVAEIDFTSMYPWIIYNRNISPDTILPERDHKEDVPVVPVSVSHDRKGVVPEAIKPMLDRRMGYKNDPAPLNKQKAVGLKWVLVTSYGYLRFREFKLGLPSSHMSIGSYARETLLEAMHLAEERGFEVLHGIVDSLFIRKEGMKEREVLELCDDIRMVTGIPVELEGIFRWMCFLPSVNDAKRPVPTSYFGAYRKGGIKARGIEVRQESVPLVVRDFQEKVLKLMADCRTAEGISSKVPSFIRLLNRTIASLSRYPSGWLSASVNVSKTDYRNNIAQKRVLDKLKSRGIDVRPGERIHYCHDKRGVVLPDSLISPDAGHYRKLMIRSLHVILSPFGYSRQEIETLSKGQTTLMHKRIVLSKIAGQQSGSGRPLDTSGS